MQLACVHYLDKIGYEGQKSYELFVYTLHALGEVPYTGRDGKTSVVWKNKFVGFS